jgi:transcriptional regulator with GAF, ATPase, and Fis domain
MVMGAPAKVRRQVTDEEVARIDQHWQHYVEYKNTYIADFGLRIADSMPSRPENPSVEIGQEGNSASRFNFKLPEEGISLEDVERSLIAQAMERTNWNITRAAKLLGLSFRTLQYRLDKFGMNKGTQE